MMNRVDELNKVLQKQQMEKDSLIATIEQKTATINSLIEESAAVKEIDRFALQESNRVTKGNNKQ